MDNTNLAAKWRAWAPHILSIFRIVAAAIFITSGTTKLLGWPSGMPEGVEFKLMSQVGLGAVLEVGGGTLMLLGLWTRPVAFVLSGMMAVAYFQFHGQQSPWPTVNMGIPAIMYSFFWLYLSAAGPGSWSLDALRRNKA